MRKEIEYRKEQFVEWREEGYLNKNDIASFLEEAETYLAKA